MPEDKPITLADLVALATNYHTACVKLGDNHSAMARVAKGVVDLLAEGSRCGAIDLELSNEGVGIPAEWATWYSPDEARALGRMLFVAADEAEAMTHSETCDG